MPLVIVECKNALPYALCHSGSDTVGLVGPRGLCSRVGRCSAEPDTRRKPPEGAAPTADQMRSHLDLDLMATPLWVPVKLSAAREGERFERVIAKKQF